MDQTEETVDYLHMIRRVQKEETRDKKEKDDSFRYFCGESCDYTAVSTWWDRVVNEHGQER